MFITYNIHSTCMIILHLFLQLLLICINYSSGNNFFLFENLLFLRISYRSYEVNTPKKQFYIYIIIYKEVFTSTCISD